MSAPFHAALNPREIKEQTLFEGMFTNNGAFRDDSRLYLGTTPNVELETIWEHDITEVKRRHYSHGNAFRKLGKSKRDIGGDFITMRTELLEDKPTPVFYMQNASGIADTRFWGFFQACGTYLDYNSNSWPEYLFSSEEDLNAFGTTAIANVEPTNPLSGLAVALGELKREGLPSVPGIQSWKSKAGAAKSVGSEYLNKEFGWDPLLADIRDFARVTRNAEKLIEQYERGSGNLIKRSYHVPTEVTSWTETGTGTSRMYPSGIQISPMLKTSPKWSQTHTVEKTRWFEGAFTYYLPPHNSDGSNFERNRRLAHKLYGASITPEVLWDLTPWSWAADWVSNAGDVFHNIGAFADNGLVMPWGYVMEKIVHTVKTDVWDIRTYRSEQPNAVHSPQRMSCSQTLRSTTKVRKKATPYGFGLNFGDFSSFQLSILAALGLSRRG